MKCDEVLSLRDPYLDSELDAKTTIELDQHLKACATCARAYAEAQRLEALMKAGLNQGTTSAALWTQIQRSVTAAASAVPTARASLRSPPPKPWLDTLLGLGHLLQPAGHPLRGVWAGLAAAWLVILALHYSARETDSTLISQHRVPSASEMRFALKQKQSLMTDLVLASGPAQADKPAATPPSPRSDRRPQTLNT